ncbi:CPBP family intramembrane glutamic endopeptidase [Virgibacillus profundi]|uniref:CPBP family intramembrane glutamic endopeptidase n=1 Tax=Virgibacillus profundi TaxID=2024555 RepID=UPI00267EFBC4
MKQSELIKQMSDEELKKQLVLSQILILFAGIVLSLFLFDSQREWLFYFEWDLKDILIYGFTPGLLIVFVDMILIYSLPKKYYDDDGINDRIFSNQSILYIFSISLIVAVSEELLFRGVIQTTFGYVFASVLFALIHFRYIKKPVMLISIFFVSFFIDICLKSQETWLSQLLLILL